MTLLTDLFLWYGDLGGFLSTGWFSCIFFRFHRSETGWMKIASKSTYRWSPKFSLKFSRFYMILTDLTNKNFSIKLINQILADHGEDLCNKRKQANCHTCRKEFCKFLTCVQKFWLWHFFYPHLYSHPCRYINSLLRIPITMDNCNLDLVGTAVSKNMRWFWKM
jgi:hypothetical protein